jgi:hypothetical protein
LRRLWVLCIILVMSVVGVFSLIGSSNGQVVTLTGTTYTMTFYTTVTSSTTTFTSTIVAVFQQTGRTWTNAGGVTVTVATSQILPQNPGLPSSTAFFEGIALILAIVVMILVFVILRQTSSTKRSARH